MLRDLAAEIAALLLPPMPLAPTEAPFVPLEAILLGLPDMEESGAAPVAAAAAVLAGEESRMPGAVLAVAPPVDAAAILMEAVNEASLPMEAFPAEEGAETAAGFPAVTALSPRFVSQMAAALKVEESFLPPPSILSENSAAAVAFDPVVAVSLGDGMKTDAKSLWFSRHDGVKVTEKRDMPITIHFHGDIRETTDIEEVIATIRSRMTEEFSAQSDLPYNY